MKKTNKIQRQIRKTKVLFKKLTKKYSDIAINLFFVDKLSGFSINGETGVEYGCCLLIDDKLSIFIDAGEEQKHNIPYVFIHEFAHAVLLKRANNDGYIKGTKNDTHNQIHCDLTRKLLLENKVEVW